jgi:hypothetical protein
MVVYTGWLGIFMGPESMAVKKYQNKNLKNSQKVRK